jgi:Acyl-CoA dehydrogenase, C-terminal domain
MGYIEETGIAQLLRDARIAMIYEGTSGIQALDLVGRKLRMVGDREQAIGVRGQVDTDDLGLLVDDMVDEAGVLVAATTCWMAAPATAPSPS